jgi:ABC-2 type transport system ATP-binding protein
MNRDAGHVRDEREQQDPPTHGPMPLQVLELHKTYPGTRRQPARVALDGLSLEVPAGEWVILLGPNGSGKSTLVRVISGADIADAGCALVFGHDLAMGGPAARRAALSRMAIVLQRPGLDKLLTVQENLRSAAALFGLGGADREARIRALAERLEFTDRLGDRVATLSGGYQRRVDLARALLHDPELLILDEATAGLDHQSRAGFLQAISDLRSQSRRPMTVVMTTHLMDEAERAGRVVMMARGKVVADDSPGALRAQSGGRILRLTAPSDLAGAEVMKLFQRQGLGLEQANGVLTARVEQSSTLEPLVLELMRRDIAFEVAPPNLGDAYLKLTGIALGPGEGQRG